MLVGGLIAIGAYKLSKRDVQRVEEHTGRDVEELSDAELEQAMDDLNIEKKRRESGDQEIGEPTQDAAPSYLDELERLGKLRDQGFITNDEFEEKKRQLLGL